MKPGAPSVNLPEVSAVERGRANLNASDWILIRIECFHFEFIACKSCHLISSAIDCFPSPAPSSRLSPTESLTDCDIFRSYQSWLCINTRSLRDRGIARCADVRQCWLLNHRTDPIAIPTRRGSCNLAGSQDREMIIGGAYQSFEWLDSHLSQEWA